MLIHPWDAALDAAEWKGWLASTDRFGMLAVNNLDPLHAPIMLPTHFTLAGGDLLIHQARPNPVWPHLEAAVEARLAVVGDYVVGDCLGIGGNTFIWPHGPEIASDGPLVVEVPGLGQVTIGH